MRIAIYGGTFNPIHIGHTSLASSLIQQNLADEVWLLVSPQNPLKQYNEGDYDHRINMAKLATKELEKIHVSDFERNLPLPSYTINTLTELQKKYPQHTFSLVIGADNWERMPRWNKHNEIIEKFQILIYQRPGHNINASILPTAKSIQIVNTPLYDISSTEIRNQQKLDMIHPDVQTYIREHKLYNW